MTNRSTPWAIGSAFIQAGLTVLALTAAAGVAGGATPADTLVWDIAAGPQYVDPVMGTSAQANVWCVQNVYERLVWYDRASTQPIPWLATGWEVKDGGQRYVFKLARGSGSRTAASFDAKAVKFSFDRAVLHRRPDRHRLVLPYRHRRAGHPQGRLGVQQGVRRRQGLFAGRRRQVHGRRRRCG